MIALALGRWWHELIGRLLGLDDVRAIESVRLSFAAPWAQASPAWIVLGCLVLAALAVVFYARYQGTGRRRFQTPLTVLRAVALCALGALLAEPVLVVKLTNQPRPLLWVLLDGTDSMGIEDQLSAQEQSRLAEAVGLPPADAAKSERKPSRADLVRSWVGQPRGPLVQLNQKYRLRGFVLDRADGVRSVELAAPGGDRFDPQAAAAAVTTAGQVTALGRGLEDMALRQGTSALAGVVVVSDFDQNAGPAALAKAKSLGVPIYAVGVGPETAVDLSVDLQVPPVMKKAEQSRALVRLRQTGLDRQTVEVRLLAQRRGDQSEPADREPRPIATRTVELAAPSTSVEIPYTPDEVGRFDFFAEVSPQPGEVIEANNRNQREVNVRDDFLRLLFVEHEPTWEWRFIKEVFHRDKLVGQRGFRTFLRSADPKVRMTNELFLPTLTPKRSEFFANDVIFLGDVQAATLGDRFPKLVKEFVGTFGGGLVVIAGPRFGPGQLADTELADMLPVVLDREARLEDQKEFSLQLTAAAEQIDFMQLGDGPGENAKAWNHLGPLPWYQPVARLHPLGTALAEHPADKCSDGRTPQPLVALRRYGKGEVVYLGFNQTWRLRRLYGEKFYRQFWGQMIHRLGLSHALGSQKRFVARTDRQRYQVDEKATLTAEVYDANFEPLSADQLADRKITGELIPPDRPGGDATPRPITLAQLREGVFETRLPLGEGGDYRARIKDPITGDSTELHFSVTGLSAERRSAVRNVALQNQLAAETGGRAYDLTTAGRLTADIRFQPRPETLVRVLTLWNTWLSFGLVVAALLLEWSFRKLANLP